MTKRLTHRRLLQVLRYDPETGKFFWKIRAARRIHVGDEAGADHEGYVVISLDGTEYRAHRLAWFYTTRRWPRRDVDHRNLIRNDNRWDNLRNASRRQNCQNRPLAKRNKVGIKGVVYRKDAKKFRAVIKVNGKYTHLGYFTEAKAAGEAYKRAAAKHFGEFARVS